MHQTIRHIHMIRKCTCLLPSFSVSSKADILHQLVRNKVAAEGLDWLETVWLGGEEDIRRSFLGMVGWSALELPELGERD